MISAVQNLRSRQAMLVEEVVAMIDLPSKNFFHYCGVKSGSELRDTRIEMHSE